MAETVNLNIRIDKEIRNQAEIFFADLGMSISTAISIFLRQALHDRKIPFEIARYNEPYYTGANLESIRQSIAEGAEGKFITKTMDERACEGHQS